MKSIRIIEIGRESSLKSNLVSFLRACGRLTFLLLPLFLFLDLPLLATAASDGALDPSFNQFQGVSKIPIIHGQADYLTLDGNAANGVSLIYGYFTSINDSAGPHNVNSIARLTNLSGTVDSAFNIPLKGPDGTGVGEVRGALAATHNGNSTDPIILWGSFSLSASDDTTYYNLARLTNSGSGYVVDTSFPHIFNQGGLVAAAQVQGTYRSDTSYLLVGGDNLRVPGDTTHAYHLIRLKVSSGDYVYDSSFTAYSRPGGYVSNIQILSSTDLVWPGGPVVIGTLIQGDGSYHWLEVLSGTDEVVTFLGKSQVDGPISNMGGGARRIIVGNFKKAFDYTLNCVAQLNSTLTGLDDTSSFNTNIHTLGGANHSVKQFAWTSSWGPILAGNLTKFNGDSCGHIVRLNYSGTKGGTVDTSFNYDGATPKAGADDRIFRLYVPKNQSYLQILGSFQYYNGADARCIASLSTTDGSKLSYYSGLAAVSNTPGAVYAMNQIWINNGQTGQGYIVIGGDFTGVNGKSHQNLALLNLDGTVADKVSVAGGPVKCIREDNNTNGQLLVAGNFSNIQGVGCTGLARLNADGTFDTTFKPIMTQSNGTVADLHSADTDQNVPGKYNIMGVFAKVANSSHSLESSTAFARLNSDGALDSTFNAQISIPQSSNIYVNAGGSMGDGSYGMVGYYQKTTNSSDCGFASVLDKDGNQTKLLTFNGEVTCADGSESGIVLGGKFTQVTYPVEANRNFIAAITPSFTLDSSFVGSTNGPLHAIRAQGENNDGKLLIGGIFTTYNGTGINNVARLNRSGSLDTTFNPGSGPNGKVYAIEWTHWGNNGPTVGKAILGGAFTSYNDTTMPGIAQVFASQANFNPGALFLLLGD